MCDVSYLNFILIFYVKQSSKTSTFWKTNNFETVSQNFDMLTLINFESRTCDVFRHAFNMTLLYYCYKKNQRIDFSKKKTVVKAFDSLRFNRFNWDLVDFDLLI